jgi:replicative DNA helicase
MLQNMLWRYSQNSTWSSVFFSLEMPIASVTERYLQMFEGLTGRDIEAIFSNGGQTALREEAQKYFLEGLQRYYAIPTRVSLPDIAEYVRLIESEKNTKVGVVGIDYLGLLDGPGANSYEMVSRLARGVKGLAKMLGLPVVLLSQVSRKGGSGNTAVSLEMGRDSGAIEESADFVLGLWQQEGLSVNSEPPPVELICRILKNRKGPINSTWKLELEAHSMQIGTGATPYVEPKTARGVEL